MANTYVSFDTELTCRGVEIPEKNLSVRGVQPLQSRPDSFCLTHGHPRGVDGWWRMGMDIRAALVILRQNISTTILAIAL
jgi:hypothetical protein